MGCDDTPMNEVCLSCGLLELDGTHIWWCPVRNLPTRGRQVPEEPRSLKDSGKRVQYGSGMVRDIDENKPAFELMFPLDIPCEEQMLTRVAEHLRKGALKYQKRNWEKANSHEEIERATASAVRHAIQWITGESDEDHAAAMIINVIFAETIRYKVEKGA